MSTQPADVTSAAISRPADSAINKSFVTAWLFVCVFYFIQYALRSAPGVMIPELSAAFGLTALGLSSLLGLYFYTYAGFAIVAGASALLPGSTVFRRTWPTPSVKIPFAGIRRK